MPPDAPYISGLTLGSPTVLGLRAEAPKVPAGEAAMFVQINRTKKNRKINKSICIVCNEWWVSFSEQWARSAPALARSYLGGQGLSWCDVTVDEAV